MNKNIINKTKKILIVLIMTISVFVSNIIYKVDLQKLKYKTNDFSQKKHEKIISNKNSTTVNLSLYSKSAVLLDAQTNRILYSKNSDIEMPMASTTKIMTCICAIENSNLDDMVTFSNKAASQPQVKLGASENEKIQMKSLLYSLMLESHNDTAVAIAEHVSGSVEKFAELMNQKARDLGCYNTYFITPNGLDSSVVLDDNTVIIHHTTAVELAKIMNYCVYQSPKKEMFLEITQTPSIVINDAGGNKSYSLTNHNAALTIIDGAVSGKTGFTNDAGYCYVGSFVRNDKKLTIALLACGWPNNKTYKWKDAKTLIEYGDENFNFESLTEVAENNDIPSYVKVYNCGCFCDDVKLTEISVDNNFSDTENIKYLKNENEDEKIVYRFPENIKGEVEENEIIGTANHIINDCVIAAYPIKTIKKITKNTFVDNVYEICQLLLL